MIESSRLSLTAAGAVTVIATALSACGSPQDEARPGRGPSPTVAASTPIETPIQPKQTPTPTPTPTPKPDPHAGEVKLQGAFGTYYASPAAIGSLTTAAAVGTYTIGRDKNGATTVAIIVCEWIDQGITTWEEQIADDISAGAPPADARGFNNYLRDVWCPEIGL